MSDPAQKSQDSLENKKESPTQNPNPTPLSEICHVSPFTRTIIDIHDLDSLLTKNVNHGVCGGHNLGNTCFMNSSIACLSNCSELTAYFLTEKFKQNINKKNKQGLQGKLAYAWYDLLKQYWTTKTRTGDPSAVKSTVAKKVKKFAGYGQQDSNEFMTEFLSILNEDLNKSDKKEYKELKEKGKDETELECAKRFWDLHLKRNDSIITDLFCGLLKSNVVCSQCGFNNITFDPFSTLTLAIPSKSYIRERLGTHMDIQIFYIPKYCFGRSCSIAIHVPKDIKYKDIGEEINKIDNFGYKLDKLIYIKVSDSKMKNIMDLEEEKGNKGDYIFIFDDLRKNANTKIIPLYMFKSEAISAFPRILFLDENTTFAELKKQIYYYARNFITNPYAKNEEQKGSLDDKLQQMKNNNEMKIEEREKYINESIELIDKEYNKIFVEDKDKEELNEYFNDFPFKITLTKTFEDTNHITLFEGKNNLESLKELNITTDEDSIKSLLENKDYCINLILKPKSNYSIPKINLNSCVTHQGKDLRAEVKGITLDNLLDYFCSDEHLEKGNEWKCGNCHKKVNITKKFSIFYVPKLLIICLKRFAKSGYGYSKDGTHIDFPIENLDIGKYICGPDKDHSKYDLFAVSQHYGGCGGGHYTAVCKNIDGNWYGYNDSSVSSTSASSAITSAAYVLFYRRKNW
jgi:ubiquitin carboxyl-terminal hydrolase 4/11/15